MQILQLTDLPAQRNDIGKFEIIVHVVVQDHFSFECHKKRFSSKEIQRQIGRKRYEPVWAMVHKLRNAMGQRDERYTLEGMIEMDEGHFTIEASEQAHRTQKAGRGSETKSNVMVMAESTILEDLETGKSGKTLPLLQGQGARGPSGRGYGQYL